MSSRLLVDLGATGRVRVGSLPEGCQEPSRCEPFAAPLALGESSLDDLRWYLEDYLRAPYGVYSERGREIGDALERWGEHLFATLFASEQARATYEQFRAQRDKSLQLLLSCGSAYSMSVPWELIRDPVRGEPLALDGIGLTRILSPDTSLVPLALDGPGLRLLLVIARDARRGDIGYRMIGRAVMESLREFGGNVDIEVLRPPTLESLHNALADAAADGRPFHVVHFDCHGWLSRDPTHPDSADLSTRERGFLALESRGGGLSWAAAEDVADALQAGAVPLVVLNACESGAVGSRPEATIAAVLLRGGVSSVVGMAYKVYAVAAAEFMDGFYGAMFAGSDVDESVTAGRHRMHLHAWRPSPRGHVELMDWLVPVHYMRRPVTFPELQASRLRDRGPSDKRRPKSDRCFVGRDAQFAELEAALQANRIVVLHGPIGIGKTELAREFGRWWRDTSGTDEVVLHSPLGTEGEPPDTSERRLLIMDDPTDDLLSCAEAEAQSCNAMLLITSRSEQRRFGCAGRLQLGPLTEQDAIEYADHLLGSAPACRARRERWAFVELLRALDGNPSVMRAVLPRLIHEEPEDLVLEWSRGVAAVEVERALDRLPAESAQLLMVAGCCPARSQRA